MGSDRWTSISAENSKPVKNANHGVKKEFSLIADSGTMGPSLTVRFVRHSGTTGFVGVEPCDRNAC
jgi:hypothetical protein